ncbi:hypothetical protein NK527_004465 [Escherichia coli]|nr:hypothetical protein [Escherichia coli]
MSTVNTTINTNLITDPVADLLSGYEFDQNGEPRMYEFNDKLYSQTEAIQAGLLTGGLDRE